MNGAQNKEEQSSSVFHNGKPPNVANHSSPSPSTDHKFEELHEDQEQVLDREDEPPVVQIEVGVANNYGC